MYCKYCNTQYADDADFCPNCGTAAANAEPQLAYSSQQYNDNQPTGFAQRTYNGFPMNWYKFLIYFALFAGAVLNLTTGIIMLSGTQYGEFSQEIYAGFPLLRTVDILFGILIIAVAGFGIYVRFELAGLKKGAPTKLIVLYVASIILSVLYLVALFLVVTSGESGVSLWEFLLSDMFSSLLASAIMLFANKVYFDKRTSLFMN